MRSISLRFTYLLTHRNKCNEIKNTSIKRARVDIDIKKSINQSINQSNNVLNRQVVDKCICGSRMYYEGYKIIVT